jgi:hypothetical protein
VHHKLCSESHHSVQTTSFCVFLGDGRSRRSHSDELKKYAEMAVCFCLYIEREREREGEMSVAAAEA